MGLYDASGIGEGGLWLDPSCLGQDLVWRHPWTEDTISNLASSTNREGTVKKFDLELAALILYKATLLTAVPEVRMATPCSGLDNTPTFNWIKRGVTTINLVVVELIRIRALHSIQFNLNPSVFNHLGQENFMADNASCTFHLSET